MLRKLMLRWNYYDESQSLIKLREDESIIKPRKKIGNENEYAHNDLNWHRLMLVVRKLFSRALFLSAAGRRLVTGCSFIAVSAITLHCPSSPESHTKVTGKPSRERKFAWEARRCDLAVNVGDGSRPTLVGVRRLVVTVGWGGVEPPRARLHAAQ